MSRPCCQTCAIWHRNSNDAIGWLICWAAAILAVVLAAVTL